MKCIDFESRKIALMGIGHQCMLFYAQFHTVLNIKYCFATQLNRVSHVMKEFFSSDKGAVYMPLKESVIRDENLLVVLCVDYDLIKRKRNDTILFHQGFEWGIDYIDSLYVIQYYRKKYNLRLEEKNIWIFGAGNSGTKFYEEYKDIYTIRGFVSNYEQETECRKLPVIRPEQLSEQDNFYAVICAREEIALSRQMREMGYEGVREYAFEDMLPKKLLIAVGTCQIERVAGLLRKNGKFCSYHISIYRDSIYTPCSEADNRRLKEYGRFCDTVFYNTVNAGTLEQRSYESFLKGFYPEAQRFHMPFYYFQGQLQQATETENNYTIAFHQRYFWLRGDGEINRMIENGWNAEEIISEISRADYWTKEEIREHFARELKKIEIWDRFSSFPVKDFIEQNYRKMVVFSDGTHFNIYLSLYLANEIAGRLGLEPIELSDIADELEDESKKVMPVYPCVRKALGMDIEDSYRFYNQENGEWETLGFEEYIKKYIQYVMHVKSIGSEFGAIF